MREAKEAVHSRSRSLVVLTATKPVDPPQSVSYPVHERIHSPRVAVLKGVTAFSSQTQEQLGHPGICSTLLLSISHFRFSI